MPFKNMLLICYITLKFSKRDGLKNWKDCCLTPFGYEYGGRDRSGLSLVRQCPVLHTPPTQACIPTLQWPPIPGKPEEMFHTCFCSPSPLPEWPNK